MRFHFVLFAVIVGAAADSTAAQFTTIVSSTSVAGASATGTSGQPAISPDGRYVAFASDAGNMTSATGLLPYFNVYLADRVLGEITLISVSTNGTGGNDPSVGAVVSDDGRYVAFESTAGNLALNDTNGTSDIFLRDRVAGTTTLVSRERSGWTGFLRQSRTPLLSADGRRLVFESNASDLVANDTNNAADVFVFDRLTGMNSLVSVNAEGNGSRAGASGTATMTPDGQWAAFVNWVTNAASGTPPVSEIYVRQLSGAPDSATHWASASVSSNLPGFQGATGPALSADGRVVYFLAHSEAATNLYRVEVPGGVTTLVAEMVQGRTTPSCSSDGRRVAYESDRLVRIWDAETTVSTVASLTASGDPAPGAEEPKPILSLGGDKVTFLSEAGGLTSSPTNGFAQLYQRDMAAGVTKMISMDLNGRAAGNLSAEFPAVTPNGGLVAFGSAAEILSNDFNLSADVFVRDLDENQTTLISSNAGPVSSTLPASAKLYPKSISADGRSIAYGSSDLGSVRGDTNGVEDIYVRDLTTNIQTPVNLGFPGALAYTNDSWNSVISTNGRRVAWMVVNRALRRYLWRDLDQPETRLVAETEVPPQTWTHKVGLALSPDGRRVAFETVRNASTLDPGVTDINGVVDVVLQDVLAGTNVVVSRSASENRTGLLESFAPVFSPDGRWLAFASRATNLAPSLPGGVTLFVRDLINNTTINVSGSALIGPEGLSRVYDSGATFSGDSKTLAYTAPAPHSVGVFDLVAGTRTLLCSNCFNPTINDDGRLVAAVTDVVGYDQRVLLIDRARNRTTIIGTNLASGFFTPGSATREPVLSGDGRYLVFLAERFDQTTAATPALYFRDLGRGLTMPVSVALPGGSGNGATYQPQLAADGRTLVFTSFASDLSFADYNKRSDVFAYRLGSPDTDHDGLDDDWEMAYFNTLARDGSGDYDQDGQSDVAEFQAGTDPTNAGSVLSVMLLENLILHTVTIQWNSVPGRTYDVQYKDAVTEVWSDLFRSVLAEGDTKSVVDNSEPRPAQRFYRVVFVP